MEPKKGLVVAIHPEDHSVDVMLFESGARLSGVQVLSQSATSNSGLNDLAVPDALTGEARWDLTRRAGRQIHAIVGYVGREPYIQGFLFPQVCEMTFAEAGRKIDRHGSDFYHTIDAKGNAEWYHPSGTYLRMGSTPEHEDLTGKDFDKRFKVAKNTKSAPYVNLTVANAGSPVLTLQIDPNGNLTVSSAKGKASFKFPAGMLFDTPQADFTGKIVSKGDQIAGSISTMKHVHTEQGDGKDVSLPK